MFIAPGPDGNLWFTEIFFEVGRITPTGVVTQFLALGALNCSVCDPPGCRGRGIVAGPDGNLWFVNECALPTTSRMTTAGVITGIAGSFFGPQQSITTGADGNLWTAPFGSADNVILRVTPGGSVTPFPIVSQAGAETRGALDLATGPDGNVWFTEFAQRRIGRIAPSGVITEFPLPPIVTNFASPEAITGGPDGAVWFTASGVKAFVCRITTSGDVTVFTIPPPAISLEDICLGPDGNLWFTEGSPGNIGRCTPNGVITEYRVPVGNGPVGITAGPDGNIWFTIPAVGIGRLNLGVVAAREGRIPVPAVGSLGLVLVGILLAITGFFYSRLTHRA